MYKLVYFDARGRAEISRLIFAASGTQFTDERVAYTQDWSKNAGRCEN